MASNNFENSLSDYQKTSKSSKKNAAKMIGYGAAAAAGLLTCNQAEADIIWTGPLGPIGWADAAYAFDIDGDGNNDLAWGVGSFNATAGNGGWVIFAQGTKGGFAMQGTNSNAGFPAAQQQAFSDGTVSAGNVNTTANGWMGWAAGGNATSDAWGNFAAAGVSQTGIVGFQFDGSSIGGGTDVTMNGWIRLLTRWDDNDGSGTYNAGDNLISGIFEWAYNNDPTSTYNGIANDGSGTIFEGTPGGIHIGAVPEPGSASVLALLALGAVGVRRRKQAA